MNRSKRASRFHQRLAARSVCSRSAASKSGKPHIKFFDGAPRLFPSFWKSLWPAAASVSGRSVTSIQAKLASRADRNRFGFRLSAVAGAASEVQA